MESPAEAARLEAKTDARVTRRLLRLTGLGKGTRALDAGAGTGAVAREMGRIVGPTGAVLALDGSPGRLSEGRRLTLESSGSLEFLAGDLRRIPIRDGSFDYVWCRFVFEYLSNPGEVFDELLRLVKPGGKLVVGDLDGNGLFHYPFPDDLSEAMKRLETGLRGRFDPSMGRKLYRFFWERKLGNIRTHLFPYNVYAGRASSAAIANWGQKLEVLKPIGEKILGTFPYKHLTNGFLDFLAREDTLTYSVLFLVEGTRE
jgi:ubiquinone/menaquinone biosynthesis C-methylase UbiE